MVEATGAVLAWPADELVAAYRNYQPRLVRARRVAGMPATVELRERCDDRVWRYLLWVDRTEHAVNVDPFDGGVGRDAALAAYRVELVEGEGLDEAAAEVELAIVADMHHRIRHGGNRLPPGHPHRQWTPSYDRVRQTPPDDERHDENQRNRTERAADEAMAAGELTLQERTVLRILVEASDDYLICPITLSVATIGERAGGFAPRTVGGWLARLRRKGWVLSQHRLERKTDPASGVVHLVATSNLTRVVIPAKWRERRKQREDAARSRKAQARAKKKETAKAQDDAAPARAAPAAPTLAPGSGQQWANRPSAGVRHDVRGEEETRRWREEWRDHVAETAVPEDERERRAAAAVEKLRRQMPSYSDGDGRSSRAPP